MVLAAAGVPRAAALVALLAVTAAAADADDFFSPLAPIFAPVISKASSAFSGFNSAPVPWHSSL
jgi:hypothetical protein